MVTTKQRLRVGVVTACVALFAPALDAAAAVVASVDRAQVELNESFTLEVTVDTAIDVEPDASSLSENFYVGNRSHMSNTTIVNGQISRSRTWKYVLMAKRTGELTIPPIVVGKEQSKPVSITVKPASSAAPGEADIFITAEADNSESYVQGQVLYRVKVYRAVSTRQPRLSEPDFSGVEVLVEVAGDESSYDAVLDGKSYNVVERVYALFPQESGQLDIAPAVFEARVLRNGRITGRKIFRSDPVNVTVKPIPPPPADHPDAAWLPAREVRLSEEWSRDLAELPAGEPITRRVTTTALGQLSTQIPVLEPASLDSVKVYPDKPELSVAAVAGGIRAERRDQYALIGVAEGEVTLPAVELPWFDIGAGEWRVARLAERPLTILPPANAPAAPAPEPESTPPPQPTETVVVENPFWRRAAEGLAVAWLLTAFGWWWSRRPAKRAPAEPPPPPLYRRKARHLKEARRAAEAGDAAALRKSLLAWARLEWPHGAPRSVGELATRVGTPLADELEKLCAATYGRDGEQAWDGRALSKALRSFSIVGEAGKGADHARLPPLMPGRA